MSQSQLSVDTLYNDSEKVLRDLAAILSGEEVSATLTLDASSVSVASGRIAWATLRAAKEVIDNARQTTIIPNKSTRS